MLDIVVVADSEGVVPEQATANRANIDRIVARTIFCIMVLSSGLESQFIDVTSVYPAG